MSNPDSQEDPSIIQNTKTIIGQEFPIYSCVPRINFQNVDLSYDIYTLL